jgi:cellobiose-specific phosphotransferase system component IIA
LLLDGELMSIDQVICCGNNRQKFIRHLTGSKQGKIQSGDDLVQHAEPSANG